MCEIRKRTVPLVLIAIVFCVLWGSGRAWGVPEKEPNNDYDAAMPIKISQAVDGSVKYPDADYYRIKLPEGIKYQFTFSSSNLLKGRWDLLTLEQWHSYDDANTANPVGVLYDDADMQYANTASFSEPGTGMVGPSDVTLEFAQGILYLKIEGKKGRPKLNYKICVKPYVENSIVTKAVGKKKAVTVKFRKVRDAARYQIRYSAKRSMKGARTVTVGAAKASCTIKKLKAGRRYYFQVRAGKKVGGKIYYSSWCDGRNNRRISAKVK